LNEKKSRWDFVATEISGDTVWAGVAKAGIYQVFADNTNPRIEFPTVVRHRMYAGDRTCPEIEVPLVDEGAGIDGLKSKMFLDGQEQITRWDSNTKKLFVLLLDQNILRGNGSKGRSEADHRSDQPAATPPPPLYAVRIIAVDRVGNEAVLNSTLSIPSEYYSHKPERNPSHVE
jgi:hypothetical protein